MGAPLSTQRHTIVFATLGAYLVCMGVGLALGVPTALAASSLVVAVTAWAYGARLGLLSIAAVTAVEVGFVLALLRLYDHPDMFGPATGDPLRVMLPVLAARLLMCFGMAALRNAQLRLAASERELQVKNDALTRVLAEVKELRGLLPICMHCKSIKDEEGDWNRVETYLQRRSKARFSHGLCPTCFQAHYPQEWALSRADADAAAE